MVGEFARVLALPDDPDTPLRGALSGYKAVAWATPIPLHEVTTVGKALGCTINDVLMSTVAGALGGYLRAQGFDTTRPAGARLGARSTCAAADEPLSLGNRFGLVFVEHGARPRRSAAARSRRCATRWRRSRARCSRRCR